MKLFHFWISLLGMSSYFSCLCQGRNLGHDDDDDFDDFYDDDDIPYTSMAPSPLTSMIPSLSMAPSSAWHISSAKVIFDIDSYDNKPLFEINHLIGSAVSEVKVTLMQNDCSSVVPDGDGMKLLGYSKKTSPASLEYEIKFDPELKSVTASSNGEINFCTKVEMLDENDLSISFKKQRFSMSIDMTVDFPLITVNIEESDIQEFTYESIEYYSIGACLCQTDFSCSDDADIVVDQDTDVGICVTPSASIVQYKNFDITVTGMKSNNDVTFSYQPVIVTSSGSVGMFGTTIQPNGHITRINFPLVTGLFDNDATKAQITSSGSLEFVTRSLTKDSTERGFALELSLNTDESIGCGNKIKQGFKKLFA